VIEHNPCFDDVNLVQIYEVELVVVGEKNQVSGFFIKLIQSFLSGVLIC
jgi:hypothetical protein